jgi:hypothetical protein
MTTTAPNALSLIFKERIQNMPDDLDEKEIIVYAKNIIKLVNDLKKIGRGKKNPKNKG